MAKILEQSPKDERRTILVMPANLTAKEMNIIFGPLSGKEEFVYFTPGKETLQHVLAKVGVFANAREAINKGYKGKIVAFEAQDIGDIDLFLYNPNRE